MPAGKFDLRYTFVKKQLTPGNPIANFLVVVAGALAIGVSIVLGFFAFVAMSAVVLVATACIGARVWWLRRKMRGQPYTSQTTDRERSSGGVIEGEFHVIHEDDDEA